MTRRKKSNKRSNRNDLTDSEVEELKELKADLTDSLETSYSSNSSFVATLGDRIASLIASHFSCGLESRVLSSSAPSSPTRDRSTHVSYSSRPSCESIFVNMSLLEELAPLTKSRAGFKSHVTHNLNTLNSLQSDNNLNINLFKLLEQSFSNHIQEIERKDIEISAVYDKYLVEPGNAGRKADSDATSTFTQWLIIKNYVN